MALAEWSIPDRVAMHRRPGGVMLPDLQGQSPELRKKWAAQMEICARWCSGLSRLGGQQALTQKCVTLCTLQELVGVWERGSELIGFLRRKDRATLLQQSPFPKVSYESGVGTLVVLDAVLPFPHQAHNSRSIHP